MTEQLFIATERFGPADGTRWQKYCGWAKIPGLVEVVSLDAMLCRHLIRDLQDDDWLHIVNEDYRTDYFYDLDYLKRRVAGVPRRSILGLYRNSECHIEAPPAPGNFVWMGYDLIEEETQISALTNCGGFPDVFRNEELNRFGLLAGFDRVREVRSALAERHPEESHARCEMYAIWRLDERGPEH